MRKTWGGLGSRIQQYRGWGIYFVATNSKNTLFGTDTRPVFSQLAFDRIIALNQLPVFVFLLFPPFVFDFFSAMGRFCLENSEWTFTKPWKQPLLFSLVYFKTTSSFSLKQNLINPEKREKTTLLQAYANGYRKARLRPHGNIVLTLALRSKPPTFWMSCLVFSNKLFQTAADEQKETAVPITPAAHNPDPFRERGSVLRLCYVMLGS